MREPAWDERTELAVDLRIVCVLSDLKTAARLEGHA